MEETNYEMDLLRENIHLRCFAHTIMNYRYHWHPDEYELSIVLQGTQEYCRGTETHSLFEDDLILTAPATATPPCADSPAPRARPAFSCQCPEVSGKKGIYLSVSFLPLQ